MQTPPCVQECEDFVMAAEALEFGRPLGGIVAIGAVSRSVQHAVCLRERARRNLGVRKRGREQEQKDGRPAKEKSASLPLRKIRYDART